MKRLFLIYFILSFSVFANEKPNVIIFIPGLYGSELIDNQSGENRWANVSEILFERKRLTVCEHSDTSCASMSVGKVIKEVDVIPYVWSQPVYIEILEHLRQLSGNLADIVEFPYDWRVGVTEHVQRLDELVEQYKNKGKNVHVVAHSMGGLLVSYYLQYGTQPLSSTTLSDVGRKKISSVVMAGVPFKGSAEAFINLIHGATFYGNDIMFDINTYRTFASIYQLLPAGNTTLLTPSFSSLNIDLKSTENWAHHKWSHDVPTPINMDYLESSQLLEEKLHSHNISSSTDKVNVLYIRGKGHPTLDKIIWDQKRDRWITGLELPEQAKLNSTQYEDGDLSVTFDSSELPAGLKKQWNVKEVVVNEEHRTLLINDTVIQQLNQHLLSAMATSIASL